MANIVGHHDRSIDQGYGHRKVCSLHVCNGESSVVFPEGFVIVRTAICCAAIWIRCHL